MSGLFGKPSQSSPERYAGMQISTSIQGQPIPLVYGRNRISANLGWYGNFQSHSQSSGGGKGGGGSSTSWTYTSAWLGILCIGPIQGVHQVWHDKSQVTLNSEGLTLFTGTSGQATWTGYPSGTPATQQIPYDHQAYVANNNYNLGSSASMPNLNYEVEGVVGGYSNAHSVYDADPSVILSDYLMDSVHGAGFLGSIDTSLLTGATNTYQAYCLALGIVLSPVEKDQRSATDFLHELMQMTNSDLVMSGGTLRVIPYADTAVSGTTPDGLAWSYTPNLTPIYSFTDDDYCPEAGQEPVKLTRKPIAETYNTLPIEVLDRSNYYNPSPVTASDLNDIALRGPRTMSKISFHAITSPTVGRIVAQLILQTQLYERNTYEFRVRADYSLLEPMDYIAITDSGLGLSGQVCRIVEVQDDGNNIFTIKAMEIPGTVRTTPQYNWDSASGYAANFDATPLSVSAPVIFQMPPTPASQSGGIPIGVAVDGQTSDGVWGGCEVFMSMDGGNTYDWVGTVGPAGGSRYGTLTAAITAVADPDTTSTLSIALNNTNQQLSTAATHAQADANETLILVGSGSTTEVMSYGAGTLTSAGHYNLSYLRRGLYGTSPQANSIGASFIRLDGSIFEIDLDPGVAGQTVYFKFCSFNNVGRALQSLSAVTAYSYVIPSGQGTPQSVGLTARGKCVINGECAYKTAGALAGWDSDAVTASPMTGGNISAQYSQGGQLGVGFVTSTGATANPSTNMYAIYATGGSNVKVVENGTTRYTGAAPATGDLYDIHYDGFTLDYRVNGVSVWTTQLNGASLYAAVSLYDGADVLSDIQVLTSAIATPTYWKATGNAIVNGESAMKNGGAAGWDSGVYTVNGFAACHVVAKPNSTADNCMIGLATNPTAGISYTNANYALYNNAGTWQIYESGTLVGSYGAVSVNDVAAITYDGSTNTVTYLINGVVKRTVTIAGLTLYGFCPINGVGSGWNSLQFGPTTNLKTISVDNQVVDGSLFQRTRLGITLSGDLPYNGDMEQFADGQAVPDGWAANYEVTGTGATFTRSATAYSGSYSLSIAANGASDGAAAVSRPFGVQPGMRYTLSCWAQSSVANPGSMYLRVFWFSDDADMSRNGTSLISEQDVVNAGGPTVANTWQSFSGSVQAPAGARFARISTYNWGNGTLLFDRVSIAPLVNGKFILNNNTAAAAWVHVGTLVLKNASSATFVWHTGSGYNTNGNQQSILTLVVRAGNGGASPNLSGGTCFIQGGTNPLNGTSQQILILASPWGNTSATNNTWEVYFACGPYTYGPLEVMVSNEYGDSFAFSGAPWTYGSPPANTYIYPAIAWTQDVSGRVSTINGGMAPKGSIPPTVSPGGFTYTSTTTSITASWPAMTLYRPDGTTTSVSSGNQSVTGLSASTTYTFYPYIRESDATVQFSSGQTSAVGSPAIAYTAASASGAAVVYAFANFPLASFTASTPASGSGGGGGNQFGCLHPEQMIELADGARVRAEQLEAGMLLPTPSGPAPIAWTRRAPRGAWVRVTLSGGEVLVVTQDHRFIQPDGEEIRARDLTLGQVVASRDGNLYVRGLELREECASMVSVELASPHLYYLNGTLSHNAKP